MKISFILASVDRDQELQQCIFSIEKAYQYRQDTPIEILVVIQKTKKEKDLLIRYPEMITFYYIDEIGLSAARNFAIRKSEGDYLVFIDDDATVKEDFIDRLLESIIVDDKTNAFCGKIIDPVSQIPFTKLFYNNHTMMLQRLDFRYFMGSAHVLSRKIIERIGYYDRRFGAGSKYPGAEESDVFFRLKACKEDVLYLPGLVFFHRISKNTPPHIVYEYSYATGAMLAKNCILDKRHFFIYFWILAEVAIKAYIRIIQNALFSVLLRTENRKQHYQCVLIGHLRGFVDFATHGEANEANNSTLV